MLFEMADTGTVMKDNVGVKNKQLFRQTHGQAPFLYV
jgi:hypothetical protein